MLILFFDQSECHSSSNAIFSANISCMNLALFAYSVFLNFKCEYLKMLFCHACLLVLKISWQCSDLGSWNFEHMLLRCISMKWQKDVFKSYFGHFYVGNSIFYQNCPFLWKNKQKQKQNMLKTLLHKLFLQNASVTSQKYQKWTILHEQSITSNTWQPLHAWVILWQNLNKDYTCYYTNQITAWYDL